MGGNKPEEWRAVAGSDRYEVSSFGQVRSLDHTTADGRRIKGRVLRLYKMPNGYMQVSLGADAKRYVHRLVCEAWHGEPALGAEAAHLDGTKINNAASNLVWATRAENEQHKKMHGTYERPRVFKQPHHRRRGPKPKRHPLADDVIQMRKAGASIVNVAEFLGMSKSGAYGVIRNRCP